MPRNETHNEGCKMQKKMMDQIFITNETNNQQLSMKPIALNLQYCFNIHVLYQ